MLANDKFLRQSIRSQLILPTLHTFLSFLLKPWPLAPFLEIESDQRGIRYGPMPPSYSANKQYVQNKLPSWQCVNHIDLFFFWSQRHRLSSKFLGFPLSNYILKIQDRVKINRKKLNKIAHIRPNCVCIVIKTGQKCTDNFSWDKL